MRHSPNAGLMLAHHLRHWTNINRTTGATVLFETIVVLMLAYRLRCRANTKPTYVQNKVFSKFFTVIIWPRTCIISSEVQRQTAVTACRLLRILHLFNEIWKAFDMRQFHHGHVSVIPPSRQSRPGSLWRLREAASLLRCTKSSFRPNVFVLFDCPAALSPDVCVKFHISST